MGQHEEGIARIEGETLTPLGRLNLTHWDWLKPIDFVTDANPHQYSLHMKLLVSPDGGQACFPDQWSRHRFEPIGRTFLVPASQTMHFKCGCQKSSVVCCWFGRETIDRWFNGELEWTDTRLKQSLDIVNPTISNLLFRLSEELRMPNIAGDTLIELIFAEILIELARHCLGYEERSDAGALTAWRMQRINERLAEAGVRPSLTELAGLCSLSPRQLTRVFRKSTGYSIGTYIAQNRISHAKQLLRSDEYIKIIAQTLGFSSSSHFCAAFLRATGETPHLFRQRVIRQEH